MQYIQQKKIYRANNTYLRKFLRHLWYIPSDVLQRSIEANIWGLCSFKQPVLEIGIGNGIHSKMLFSKHGKFAVGIDIEKEGLAMAKQIQKYKKVMYANAQEMPFRDGQFQTVVSNSTFEHIVDDAKAAAEVARVLKKDGLFFMTVPTNYLLEWATEYEKKLSTVYAKKKINDFNKRAQHFHYRSLNYWQKCFKKNNMEIVFYQYYFPKEVALFWYKVFRVFTYQIRGRELWSYFGHSKITKYLPKDLLIFFLEKIILRKKFSRAFFTNSQPGAQLFIIAQKNK